MSQAPRRTQFQDGFKMKMAKPDQRDIAAACGLASLLFAIDRNEYPIDGYPVFGELADDAPTWFDDEDIEHLKHLHQLLKRLLLDAPGFPGRVIDGMCHVIMNKANKIIDPDADTIELHPEIVQARKEAERYCALVGTQLPIAFMGKGYFDKPSLDAAIDIHIGSKILELTS
jgi:hypothetical protein